MSTCAIACATLWKRSPSASTRWWTRPPAPSSVSSRREEADDGGGQRLAAVLLEEVTAALDRHVGLSFAARYALEEDAVGAASDGIAVAERAEERLVPLVEH